MEKLLVRNDQRNPNDDDSPRQSEKRGMDGLLVISLFSAAVLLLIALLYFAY